LSAVHFQYKADSASLSDIREDLRNELSLNGIDKEQQDKIIVAVNEVCMNIICHASNGHYSGNIDINISFEADKLLIEVDDDAEPANLDRLKLIKKDKLSPGGLGLFFIDEIMDDVVYSHRESSTGNSVRMIKVLNKQHEI